MSDNIKPQPFIPNDATELLTVDDGDVELVKVLSDVVINYQPRDEWPSLDDKEWGDGGIYCGPTGIAYLFMTVHTERPDLLIEGTSCHDWAGRYLQGRRSGVPPMPDKCGIIAEGPCFAAVCAAYYQSDTYVKTLVDYVPTLLDPTPKPDGTPRTLNYEYVWGLSGLLYLLRLVRTWYPASTPLISPAISRIITRILSDGPPWIFNNWLTFLGTGHGDMGIVLQIVLSDPTYATHPAIQQTLSHILDAQLANGNWRACAPDAVIRNPDLAAWRDKELVQWCHGAPGIVQSLVLLLPHFPSLAERMRAGIEAARELVWREGLLTKEPNLCHGSTGNAFTFPPGERREHFLAMGTEERVRKGLESGEFEKSDYGRVYCLGFGTAGRAVGWLWRERDARVCGKGCYLSYDDV